MAGVKQFDVEGVLDRAMTVFWTRGYDATSIQDLVKATGINRASIYGTFGDKKGLFLAVLDHYSQKVGQPLLAELDDDDPRRAVDRMLRSIIRRNSDSRFPPGCLVTNTALECPVSDADIKRAIEAGLLEQETTLNRVFSRARKEGLLNSSADARALARFFMGVANGMNVISRALDDPQVLADIAEVAMRVWDAKAKLTDQVTAHATKGVRHR